MKHQFVQTELGSKHISTQNTKNISVQTDLLRDQLEMFIHKSSYLDATEEAHKKLDVDYR